MRAFVGKCLRIYEESIAELESKRCDEKFRDIDLAEKALFYADLAVESLQGINYSDIKNSKAVIENALDDLYTVETIMIKLDIKYSPTRKIFRDVTANIDFTNQSDKHGVFIPLPNKDEILFFIKKTLKGIKYEKRRD